MFPYYSSHPNKRYSKSDKIENSLEIEKLNETKNGATIHFTIFHLNDRNREEKEEENRLGKLKGIRNERKIEETWIS